VNPYSSEYYLQLGMEPLGCACPTRYQISDGTRYMLTYLVNWDYHVPDIAGRFSLSVRNILDANGFSEEKPVKVFFFFLFLSLLRACFHRDPARIQLLCRILLPFGFK
jgi:hypothetical protein